MPEERITVLIVDDHPVVRGGLQALIDTEAGLSVVGQACDGQEALEKYLALRPDVVVMDLVMPRKDGIEAISDIRHQDEQARILVLSSYEENEKIMLAIRAGALGFILKNAPPEELIEAIRWVYRGLVHMDPKIFQRIVFYQEQLVAENAEDKLTAREREVAKLVGLGQTNEQIAQALVISVRTVGVHISNILSKLDLANRSQIVLFAVKTGLVSLYNDDAD